MDRIFSASEISDHFWSPPPSQDPSSKFNRISSESAFQRFLQQASSSSVSPPSSSADTNQTSISTLSPPSPNLPLHSDDVQAFLKTELNLACAAVAMSRDLAASAASGSHASDSPQLGCQAHCKGTVHTLSKTQDKDTSKPHGLSSFPAMQKKAGAPLRQTTSGSSREQSDDDEVEGEIEMTESMDPADVKRVRRMLSNRESARRSRRRKQAHLTEVETQAAQLRVENSSLMKRLTDISQKYNEAAVDNRVLKADVETVRAKVKMAEDTVKRITGLNPVFHVSEISNLGMPSFDGSPSEISTDAAVPIQDDHPNHHLYQPASKNYVSTHELSVSNGLIEMSSVENGETNVVADGNKTERTAP